MNSTSSPSNLKSLILIATLIAVLVGYVMMFFTPKRHEIAKLRADLREGQNFVEDSENTTKLLSVIEEKLHRAQAYNKSWTQHAPQPSELSLLLAQINAKAREANVLIERFDPEPAIKLERLNQLPLAVGCRGQLPQIFAFLAEIEKMPQTIWLKSITIGREGKTRGLTQCEVNLAIFMDNSNNSN